MRPFQGLLASKRYQMAFGVSGLHTADIDHAETSRLLRLRRYSLEVSTTTIRRFNQSCILLSKALPLFKALTWIDVREPFDLTSIKYSNMVDFLKQHFKTRLPTFNLTLLCLKCGRLNLRDGHKFTLGASGTKLL